VSRPGRLRTAARMGLHEYARSPVLLALLVFLPAYFVGVLTYLLPASEVAVDVSGAGTVAVTTAELYGVLLVPLMAALIGGIAGLFLMLNSRDADARLVVAGYRPLEVVLARFGLLAVAGLVATAVSLGMLAVEVVPDSPVPFVVAALLLALVYGTAGAFAGLLLSRLAGVYCMLFLPMVDVFFFQNPLVEEYHWLAPYLPGHFATKVAVDAGFSSAVTLEPLGLVLAYAVAVGVATTAAFYRALRAS